MQAYFVSMFTLQHVRQHAILAKYRFSTINFTLIVLTEGFRRRHSKQNPLKLKEAWKKISSELGSEVVRFSKR